MGWEWENSWVLLLQHIGLKKQEINIKSSDSAIGCAGQRNKVQKTWPLYLKQRIAIKQRTNIEGILEASD